MIVGTPSLQTASDLIEIERPLSPKKRTFRSSPKTSNERPLTGKSSHSEQTRHATTKSFLLKRISRNKDKDGSFKRTTSFATNEIQLFSGKGGLSSAYPSDFHICRP